MEYIETGYSITDNEKFTIPDTYRMPILATGSNYYNESTKSGENSDESYLIIPSTVTTLSIGDNTDDKWYGYALEIPNIRIPSRLCIISI